MKTGDLDRAVRERSARALASGALHPLATRLVVLREGHLALQVRVLPDAPSRDGARGDGPRSDGTLPGAAGGARDPARPRRPAPPPGNPFLHPEPELRVADVPPSHRAVLNKYPVVEGHLLLVTRRFEPQETPLSRADFAALARVLAELDWLAFYNAGPVAGASQPHKHLQLVPPLCPLCPGEDPQPARRAPLEDRIRAGRLPFPHAVAPIADPADPGALAALYARLRGRARGPYNLLVAREWMLYVPRTRAEWRGIAVNALGFAGALLVRGEAGLERLRAVGPAEVLRRVSQGDSSREPWEGRREESPWTT